MKESGGMRLKYVVYESTLSTADAVPLPRWGRLRGATLRVNFYKGRCPKVVGIAIRGKRISNIRGEPTPSRYARQPLPEEGARMIFQETLIQSLSFAVRDSRSPPHVPRTSPLSSAVFHTASALSAPLRHLPLEGKAAMREYHPLKKGGEAAT